MKVFRLFDTKNVMAHILTQNTFDDFLLSEVKINGKATMHLTGTPAAGFFSEEEMDERGYVAYGFLRPICLEMIKGQKTPESFTFMFLLPTKKLEALLEETDSTLQSFDVENLSFLVRYKDGELTLTTGSAFKIFTMDKSMNAAWDSWVEKYLDSCGISFEEML